MGGITEFQTRTTASERRKITITDDRLCDEMGIRVKSALFWQTREEEGDADAGIQGAAVELQSGTFMGDA